MTEVPDYLLQRSKARRVALGLATDDGGDSGDAGGGGGAVAPAGGAAAGGGGGGPTQLAPISPKEPTPPPPEPAYVQASRARKKPPLWVASLFIMLPVYLFVYVALLGEESASTETALGLGSELYTAQCATCHLGNGGGRAEGGVGQTLYEGEVVATFPDEASMFDYIRNGSSATGEPYGNPDREGGQRISIGGMPAFANLTDYELYAIVRHEREALSGEEIDDETFALREEQWTTLNEDGGTHGTFAETVVGAAEAGGE
ncbi:MAG: c-type cytochrome [Actinomycetota bacterium]